MLLSIVFVNNSALCIDVVDEDDVGKERAWNNFPNYDAEFLFLIGLSQEEHSYST